MFEFYVTVESGDVTRSYLFALVPAAVEAVLEARVSSVRRKHEEEDCDWISDALHELKENSKLAQNLSSVYSQLYTRALCNRLTMLIDVFSLIPCR